jgi:hypothetical protein
MVAGRGVRMAYKGKRLRGKGLQVKRIARGAFENSAI